MSRTSDILNRVRLRLHEVSQQNIQDGELYSAINYVQQDIIAKSKAIERQYTLNIVSGTIGYYFPGSASVYVKSLIYLQSGQADRVLDWANPGEWLEKYSNISGSPPAYYTFFNNQVQFSPTPLVSGSVQILGYQNQLSYFVTSSAEEPELDSKWDNCIALGVMSEYDPKYYEQYMNTLNDIAKITHIKGTRALSSGEPNW